MTLLIANKIVKLIKSGRPDQVQRLLDSYSIEERQKIIYAEVKRFPLLYTAIEACCLSSLNYFLDECSVKPDYLWVAGASACLPILKSLLEHGADVNSVDKLHRTALFNACSIGQSEVVSYLLENGADLHRADYCGTTCLMASLADDDLCKLLLTNGAIVDQTNRAGKTALMLAVESRNLASIRTLLSYRADAGYVNEFGESAVFLAASKNHTDVLEEFRRHHYQLSKEIALCHAIRSCHLSVNGYSDKAEKFWQLSMRLQNLPTDTPVFQPEDPVTGHEKLRDALSHFESVDDRRAVVYLVSQLGLLNPQTLSLFGEAAARIEDLSDFVSVLRFLLHCLESASNILFFEVVLENCSLIESFVCRNCAAATTATALQSPDVKRNRLLEIFEIFASFIRNAGRRVEKMDSVESIFYFLYIESYFCSFFDFMLMIQREYSEEIPDFTHLWNYDSIKSLVNANLYGFGSANLLHVCITKRYPTIITKTLMACGADLNCRDYQRKRPIDYALEFPVYRTMTFVDLFLKYGLRLDAGQIDVDHPCLACWLRKRNLLRTPIKYSSLQCMAASTMATKHHHHLDYYENNLPLNLQILVHIHTLV